MKLGKRLFEVLGTNNMSKLSFVCTQKNRGDAMMKIFFTRLVGIIAAIIIVSISLAGCGAQGGMGGDTTENAMPLPIQNSDLKISIPEDLAVKSGEPVSIPVVLNQTDDLAGFDFIIEYDPQILTSLASSQLGTCTSTGGFVLKCKDVSPGTTLPGALRLIITNANGMSPGSGGIVNLTFTTGGVGTSDLILREVKMVRIIAGNPVIINESTGFAISNGRVTAR